MQYQTYQSDKTSPRTAIVIGGGIAGCAAAYALAQQGIVVTLIDRAPHLASGASGNPRGILHARFGAGDNPLHQFVLAAYQHALRWLDEVLPVDGVARAQCGLLQLACNAVEVKRIGRLAQQTWPPHLMQFVDEKQATELTGIEMQFGGAWFPTGGWVVPPVLCAKLASDVRITQRLGHHAESLVKTATGWQVLGQTAQGLAWQEEADVLVVCCAHTAKNFEQFAHLKLTPVRGQISVVAQTQESQALHAVVCGDGYCAPSVNNEHVLGATHAFEDESKEVRSADHAENLAHLNAYAPSLRQALGERATQDWQGRASVRCSAPGSMPLVGRVADGLYCSLGHGTRGLLTAGISAEVLVAELCGLSTPLPQNILDELTPLRRVSTTRPRV
ncbi:MAG: FAD-dependent 5-carboxymethylaminomethyl-2-thiouridine(34) oxidoreductase MnmC [Sideroxydans sp.]|nr:FAD-dependent 5-carboxymethylaminomethyl-2-thiouridine(34) oxidoreductase MnmC [Sideroxydans sp.]